MNHVTLVLLLSVSMLSLLASSADIAETEHTAEVCYALLIGYHAVVWLWKIEVYFVIKEVSNLADIWLCNF